MEPTNHPFRKKTDLPNPTFLGSMLIFTGVHGVVALNELCHEFVSWNCRRAS